MGLFFLLPHDLFKFFLVPGDGGEGGELGGSVVHGHGRVFFGFVVRTVDDIQVGGDVVVHALCPPIWLWRSMALDSSVR